MATHRRSQPIRLSGARLKLSAPTTPIPMNAMKFVASPRSEYPFSDTKTRPTAANAAVTPSTIQGHRDGREIEVGRVAHHAPLARIRKTSTGSSRPFTTRGPIDSAATVGAAETVEAAATTSPPPASDCRRCATFTASPITVYSSRPPPPIGAGHHDARVQPDPHVEPVDRVRPPPHRVQLALAILHRERAPERPLRVVLAIGSGAPKTAITASPWNLSIVPPCSEITSAIAPR